jgi:hypothetical protein
MPVTQPSRDAALESAVRRWLDAVLNKSGGATTMLVPVPPVVGTPDVRILSSATEATVLEIGRNLGATSFAGPSDLAEFLYDSLGRYLHASGSLPFDPTRYTTELLRQLRHPIQRFRFRAPLALRGELALAGPLEGSNELSLTYAEADNQFAISISGVVESPTESAAVAAIGDIVESILGASLVLDLCSMMAPRRGTGMGLCIEEIEPHDAEFPTQLSDSAAAGVAAAYFRVPESLSEIEHRHMEKGNVSEGLARQSRALRCLLASSDSRALELRHAAMLYLRAGLAADIGMSLTYCFMCLEAILLERSAKDNVLGRLMEAVAYRIGRGADDRTEIRREVKKLYDVRSQYVHAGRAGAQPWDMPRERCLDLVVRVLQREFGDLTE